MKIIIKPPFRLNIWNNINSPYLSCSQQEIDGTLKLDERRCGQGVGKLPGVVQSLIQTYRDKGGERFLNPREDSCMGRATGQQLAPSGKGHS